MAPSDPGDPVARRGTLHHIEIYVADLERSIRFWGPLLGHLGYEPYQEWDDGISWRLHDTYLAFVQAPEPEGTDRRHPGLNHLAFHVDTAEEVEELVGALRERGTRLLYEDRHPFAGGEDHYAAFVEDPDGMKVELVADDRTRGAGNTTGPSFVPRGGC